LFKSELITVKLLIFFLSIVATTNCYSKERTETKLNFFDYSLKDLSNVKVVTVSREEELLKDSPSIVTVFTRAQIRQQGLKTVDEVLQRVPGFFISRNREWQIVGSRGISTQTNKQYLYLIDGHPNKSLIFTGFHNEQEYPTLDKVERIEIIRGPGSTLWGSDAVMGVINIITRNGGDVNGAELNIGFDQYFPVNNKPRATVADNLSTTGGNANITSYRKGKNGSINLTYDASWYEDVNGMFSFTYFDGEGYELDVEGPREAGFDMLIPREDWKNSWEFYSKIRAGNLMLKARGVYAVDMDYRGSTTEQYYNKNDRTAIIEDEWRLFWIEAEHTKNFSSGSLWTNKFFVDSLYQNKAPKGGDASRNTEKDRLYEERSYGVDTLYKFRLSNHKIKIGGRVQITDIGPLISASLNYDPNTTGNYTTKDGKQYYRAPFATDRSGGVFIEDRWLINQKLNLIAGLRGDYNDLRDKKLIVLPRFASIFHFDSDTTLKYMLNTGYRRPSYWEYYRTSTKEIGTTKSEINIQHDILLMKSTPLGEFSINPYFLNVYRYIDWITQKGNGNIGNITSYGVEIDGKVFLKRGISFYGNISYNKVRVDGAEVENVPAQISSSKEIIGMPRFIYNLGVDYSFTYLMKVNFHIRGWRKMAEYNTLKHIDGHGELSGSPFLDINFKYDKIMYQSLNASIYAHNILNNDQMNADNFKGGSVASEPLSIGLKVSYLFE